MSKASVQNVCIFVGGDIRYNMMTTSSLFREAQDEEMEHKVKKGAQFID